MLDRLRKDIAGQLSLIFILGCLIASFFTAFSIFYRAKGRFEARTKEELRSKLLLRDRFIEFWLDDRQRAIEELNGLLEEKGFSDDSLRDLFADFLEKRPDYSEIFLLSFPDGRVVISTDRSNEGKIKRNRPYFIKGIAGPNVEPIHFSTAKEQNTLILSIPVALPDGQYILAARLSLSNLLPALALDTTTNVFEKNYLVNRWGALITEEKGNRTPMQKSFSAGIESAFKFGEFTGTYKDWRGKLVIGSCRHIPKLGVVLVSEVEYSRILKPIREKAMAALFATILLTCLVAGVFYLFLKRIFAPIDVVAEAARNATLGDSNDTHVDVVGSGQIGALAESFNEMMDGFERRFREIEAAEERQRRLIERASDGFVIIDRFGNIIDANPEASRLWGYDEDEIRTLLVFELFMGEDAQLLGKYIRKLYDDESPGFLELMAIRRNGNRFPAEVNAIPLEDGAHLVVIRDITEKKMLESELIKAQKLESVGTLAAGIAHDFDNILVGVLGAASLIRSTTDKSDPRYEMLEVIETSAERAAGLVKQLMTFAKQEPPQREPISIADTIEEVVRVLRSGGKGDISFRTRISSQLPMIYADAVQMKQVLFNLCLNAIDAMPDGGTLTVDVSTVEIDERFVNSHSGIEQGRFIEIAVSDTGVGIPEERTDRIFEPFFSTKPQGKGTGLGLSTAYGIVESHGGTITVDTEVGVGSTFRIYLPLITSGDPSSPKIVIAIIDRDAATRRLYRVALDRGDYRVLSFATLELAIGDADLADAPPDIVLIGSSLFVEDPEAVSIRLRSFAKDARLIVLGKPPESIDISSIDAVVESSRNVREVLRLLNGYS